MSVFFVSQFVASAAITLAVIVPFVPPALATAKARSNSRASMVQAPYAFLTCTYFWMVLSNKLQSMTSAEHANNAAIETFAYTAS